MVKQAGLYQYLALEIMIWMMFALGYNLLLGYAGLPSFGHGAFLRHRRLCTSGCCN